MVLHGLGRDEQRGTDLLVCRALEDESGDLRLLLGQPHDAPVDVSGGAEAGSCRPPRARLLEQSAGRRLVPAGDRDEPAEAGRFEPAADGREISCRLLDHGGLAADRRGAQHLRGPPGSREPRWGVGVREQLVGSCRDQSEVVARERRAQPGPGEVEAETRRFAQATDGPCDALERIGHAVDGRGRVGRRRVRGDACPRRGDVGDEVEVVQVRPDVAECVACCGRARQERSALGVAHRDRAARRRPPELLLWRQRDAVQLLERERSVVEVTESRREPCREQDVCAPMGAPAGIERECVAYGACGIGRVPVAGARDGPYHVRCHRPALGLRLDGEAADGGAEQLVGQGPLAGNPVLETGQQARRGSIGPALRHLGAAADAEQRPLGERREATARERGAGGAEVAERRPRGAPEQLAGRVVGAGQQAQRPMRFTHREGRGGLDRGELRPDHATLAGSGEMCERTRGIELRVTSGELQVQCSRGRRAITEPIEHRSEIVERSRPLHVAQRGDGGRAPPRGRGAADGVGHPRRHPLVRAEEPLLDQPCERTVEVIGREIDEGREIRRFTTECDDLGDSAGRVTGDREPSGDLRVERAVELDRFQQIGGAARRDDQLGSSLGGEAGVHELVDRCRTDLEEQTGPPGELVQPCQRARRCGGPTDEHQHRGGTVGVVVEAPPWCHPVEHLGDARLVGPLRVHDDDRALAAPEQSVPQCTRSIGVAGVGADGARAVAPQLGSDELTHVAGRDERDDVRTAERSKCLADPREGMDVHVRRHGSQRAPARRTERELWRTSPGVG